MEINSIPCGDFHSSFLAPESQFNFWEGPNQPKSPSNFPKLQLSTKKLRGVDWDLPFLQASGPSSTRCFPLGGLGGGCSEF